MPLRYLFYVSDTYSALVRDKNIYSSKPLSLPTPRFVVFYNGTAPYPETNELRLSSAYEKKTNTLDLKLRVHVININPGYNQSLMESCHTMKEYMIFVDKIRRYSKTMSLETAAELAIGECIKENVLADFLRKNVSDE